jgi:UDP-N-acetylmuramoyl-tripeptide--D-alanyl-D-alanine ligase
MTAPVSLIDLLSATGGRAVGFDPQAVVTTGVATDSRTVRPGELFWALGGEKHDGHDFVRDAYARGAAACVVGQQHAATARGPAIVVRDTLQALWDYARWSRQRQEALVIGVTGSSGKTTTRTMIHSVLSAKHPGVQSPKNYNNHIGVPLSLLDIDSRHEFAVLELGASHVGEIRDLAGIALPEVGVVTSIGLAHVERFGSLEQIIAAKGELVEALPATGFAVLAGDDEHVRRLAERSNCPVRLVGEGTHNDVRANHVMMGRDRIDFRVDDRAYSVPATGRHHVIAALATIAIAREVGLEDGALAAGLNSFRPVPGRCRLEEVGPWSVIDDTYNANPSSMQAACHVLRDWAGFGKRILVTGDMLELGDLSAECHRQLGRCAAEADVDRLLVYGEHAAHVIGGALDAGLPTHCLAQCDDFEALLAVLDCWLDEGDVVLVKGSRALRMERVVEWLRQRGRDEFDSRPARRLAAVA